MTVEIKTTSEIRVRLVDSMGDDAGLAAAAKVLEPEAYEEFKRTHVKHETSGLLSYLMEHRHGTPFEHACLKFFVHAPIFVWREWHRHRIGFCLAGDTKIWADKFCPNSGRCLRQLPLADLYSRWRYGVQDVMGRVRHLRSVREQTLRVLNEETHLFEVGRIENIVSSGIKEVFLLETLDHREFSIRCSKDHRVLTPDGWAAISELADGDYIYVSGKRNSVEVSVPPSLRRGIGVWTSMQRVSLIRPIDYCRICEGKFAREDLVLDHMVPVVVDLTKALDKSNLRPVCIECHRKKSNQEQKLSDRNIVAGSKLVQIRRKPQRVSEEKTYDISMTGPHHNFVANGIVVHNSYNEESGRYKVLEPLFYIPPRDRPMIKVDGWKPGRPKFKTLDGHFRDVRRDALGKMGDEDFEALVKRDADLLYAEIVADMTEGYRDEYDRYLRQLGRQLDPGLARDNLPVGIYSACYVTCNPRSMMAFLSLRTHEPEALKVSYPLYEIEVAARKCEEIFADKFPLTYTAFNKHRRLGP